MLSSNSRFEKYTIRTEQPCDFKAIENLTREAFWNVYRPGCTEHYVLHCYRESPDFVPELSLILEVEGEIVGHVMYAWSHIDADDGRKIKMMTFGPINIRPDFKRKGYGKILLDHSMELAKKMEGGCLLIVGNIDFYGKSSFVSALTKGIRYADDPEATYFLCKELDDGFLDGITGSYHDPEGYFVADQNPEAFDRFDAEFPPKEKLKLPGQLF
ncbi:GNAT family N-acetyltransferase [Fibrobacter succinogenes]|uniref:GNAT family N-acetyltransferase n=1 Tax=Fibrobacter succinogenes TaxID=833 RepID=UPI0015666679|nr:N-acetyltransferase [Fibrobacter succinogenes]